MRGERYAGATFSHCPPPARRRRGEPRGNRHRTEGHIPANAQVSRRTRRWEARVRRETCAFAGMCPSVRWRFPQSSPRRRRAGGAMARKGGSRVSFTPHSTTARSKNGGMTPFVERPALRAPLKVRRSHLFRLTGAREAIPGAWNIWGRRYPGPPPNWSGSVFVPVGRGGRVRIGRGRGVLEQGRTGWCWRCCCGQWGGIANRVSCCTFAVRRSNADLSA